MQIDKLCRDTVFLFQFLHCVICTVQGSAYSQNCDIGTCSDNVHVTHGDLVLFLRNTALMELLSYIVDSLALKEYNRVSSVQSCLHQTLCLIRGSREANLQARYMSAHCGPVLRMLSAVLGTYGYT